MGNWTLENSSYRSYEIISDNQLNVKSQYHQSQTRLNRPWTYRRLSNELDLATGLDETRTGRIHTEWLCLFLRPCWKVWEGTVKSHANHLKMSKNALESSKEPGLFSVWELWGSMILLCKCQRGEMPHTKELFNLIEKSLTRNKRGELKPEKLRFGRKPTSKNLGVELRTNS